MTFNVTDAGKGQHEMIVFKSDKAPSTLPVSKGAVDENAVGPKVNPFKERYWKQFGGGPKEGP